MTSSESTKKSSYRNKIVLKIAIAFATAFLLLLFVPNGAYASLNGHIQDSNSGEINNSISISVRSNLQINFDVEYDTNISYIENLSCQYAQFFEDTNLINVEPDFSNSYARWNNDHSLTYIIETPDGYIQANIRTFLVCECGDTFSAALYLNGQKAEVYDVVYFEPGEQYSFYLDFERIPIHVSAINGTFNYQVYGSPDYPSWHGLTKHGERVTSFDTFYISTIGYISGGEQSSWMKDDDESLWYEYNIGYTYIDTIIQPNFSWANKFKCWMCNGEELQPGVTVEDLLWNLTVGQETDLVMVFEPVGSSFNNLYFNNAIEKSQNFTDTQDFAIKLEKYKAFPKCAII